MPYFFFSSRRRHTRSKRDWSSDVCSSDLVDAAEDVLHRVRDLHEVVDEVLARGDELIDVRLPRRGDHRARLERGQVRIAGGDVDVAVAGEEAELLQARARV